MLELKDHLIRQAKNFLLQFSVKQAKRFHKLFLQPNNKQLTNKLALYNSFLVLF